MGHFNARTVVQDRRFELSLVAIAGSITRANDVISGIEWLLARQPEAGIKIGKYAWTIAVPDIYSSAYEIVYTFNQTHVYLMDIRLKSDYEPSGDT